MSTENKDAGWGEAEDVRFMPDYGPDAEEVNRRINSGDNHGRKLTKSSNWMADGWMRNFVTNLRDRRYPIQCLEQSLFGGLC